MFTERWKEGTDKCVTIDAIKPDVFAEILHFLITGAVSNNNVLTFDLLIAAEMVFMLPQNIVSFQ